MSKERATIIAAIIAGVFACVAAVIGLGLPIVDRLADKYFPPVTPTPTTNVPPATTIPQIQATSTQPAPQPTVVQVATQSTNLIHNEPVSPETLARIVGGDAVYWTQAGSVVWVYSNKGHNTLMRHPGDNMILTYWAGFGDPQNADGCQIIIPQADNLAKYVKCPSGTKAEIVADQVGLHLIDYTGYFP